MAQSAGADETNFIDLVIASERIDVWIKEIKQSGTNVARLSTALKSLSDAVDRSEAYAEEANRSGIVQLLTSLFKKTEQLDIDDDAKEDIVTMMSSIITTCSGPMAAGYKIKTFTFNDIQVSVQESALGDGVGAKVWTMAQYFCQQMVDTPSMVENKTVLEVGAGCGLCGMVVAKLGAKHVVLSDYVDALLVNLQQGMLLNSSSEEEEDVGIGSLELEDPEDASECSDLDDYLFGGGDDAVNKQQTSWDADNMSVRFLDWNDSLHYLDNTTESFKQHNPLDGPSGINSSAPKLDIDEKFDIIIGTEVLYEWSMAASLAAALYHRLKPSKESRIVLGCAVRDAAMFDAFYENVKKRGLELRVTKVHPGGESGMGSREGDYEGGFVWLEMKMKED